MKMILPFVCKDFLFLVFFSPSANWIAPWECYERVIEHSVCMRERSKKVLIWIRACEQQKKVTIKKAFFVTIQQWKSKDKNDFMSGAVFWAHRINKFTHFEWHFNFNYFEIYFFAAMLKCFSYFERLIWCNFQWKRNSNQLHISLFFSKNTEKWIHLSFCVEHHESNC